MKLIVIIAITTLVLFGCTKPQTFGTPKRYVLIVAGQSQAVGEAGNYDLPNEMRYYAFRRTKIWTVKPDTASSNWPNYRTPNYSKTTGWEMLDINKNQSFSQYAGNHGLEPSFAHAFEHTHPNDTLFIIKYGLGGTPLKVDPVQVDWNSNSRNELYDHFTTKYLQPAFSTLTDYIPLGFWWAQGESDGKDTLSANTYYENLQNLFTSLRKEVPETQQFKKLIAQVTYFNYAEFPHIQSVRNAQKKYCTLPENNAVLVDCDKAETFSQTNQHFSAGGYMYITSLLFPLINK